MVGSSYDGSCFLNAIALRAHSDLKGRIFGEYSLDQHNFLLYGNHITSYEDERYAGTEVDDQTTYDLHYQFSSMDDQARVTVSAMNITDEDPPLARLDLSYDGYTHNALVE